MGDPVLAEMIRGVHKRAPIERIVSTDWLLTFSNRNKLKDFERIADLACGHKAITKAVHRCACYECHKMILDGEDYDAFRNR